MQCMNNQNQTVNPTIGWSHKTEREGHGPPRSFGARPRVLEILRPINKFREHKIPAVWIGGAGSSPVAAIATHTNTVRADTYTQARALCVRTRTTAVTSARSRPRTTEQQYNNNVVWVAPD